MGIESDQVVYEYLSRVGDIAQQRQLPSATRMRLVSELRNEIDRHRARATVDSPAAVRRILDRLGSPDEVVGTASGTAGAPRQPAPPATSVPAQPVTGDQAPDPAARPRPKGPRRPDRNRPWGPRRETTPREKDPHRDDPGRDDPSQSDPGGGDPRQGEPGRGKGSRRGEAVYGKKQHQGEPGHGKDAHQDGAGRGKDARREEPALDKEMPREERPKGLRRVVPRPRPRPRPAGPAGPPVARDVPAPPHLAPAHELGDGTAPPDWWRVSGPLTDADPVPGFVGGVEIPELLSRPAREPDATEAAPAEAGAGTEPGPASAPAARRRRGLPVLVPAGWSNPLLLLAAVALVAGAVLGNWYALLLGWAIAYGSRRLTPAETKWAVMFLPGAAVAAGAVWLWGRADGRWGDPVTQGTMTDAIGETWPWVVRGAALASALYLTWRSQRTR
ncbi:hypothetical protein ACH4PW_13595 [Streptomyces sp. NPDC017082]|uniref:hypothetical protein n=1 Tax=Streptomyces sp. NPDC017082 TaxID=3364974 RepID=UPI003790A060